MDIVDIELFLTIAKTANITKTSELMHFSQSTISYRLKNLEKELGVELFYRNRGNRSVELTLQGEHFVHIAAQWLSVWQNTESLKFLPSNFLTVAAIDSISTSVLPYVYRKMAEGEYPLKLRIMTHQSGEIYDLVERQIADIGFVSIPQERRDIETKLTFLQKYYVVRYSNHPGAPNKISPKDLNPSYEIYQDWGGDYRQIHEELWGPLTNYHVWIDTVSLLQSFLNDERYWAILPETSLHKLADNFRSIQIDELILPENYCHKCYIIKHKSPKTSALSSLKAFENTLEHYLSQCQIKFI